MTADYAWYNNISIWVSLAAWLLAQSVKMIWFVCVVEAVEKISNTFSSGIEFKIIN